MDSFKDLFQEAKDRIRNPFFSSFAIAWLFFNWQITIALIFYNNELLARSGYRTYNNLINARQDNLKMLLYPFLSACFYVFVFPYLRNFITQFLANRKIENENKILEDSKKSSVKLERYVDLLRELEIQQKLVGERYSEQKKDLEKLASTQNDLSKEQQKNEELAQQLALTQQDFKSFKNSINYPKVLDGRWEVKFKQDDSIITDIWTISSDSIYTSTDNEMKIREFLYNPIINQIHFVLVDQVKEPAGHLVFYIHDKYREAYKLKYISEEDVYKDIEKGLTLKKLA